jgi:cysteine desulfurase/selenocysteine lyase
VSGSRTGSHAAVQAGADPGTGGSAVDFVSLREQTPGVARSIHLNAAGASLLAEPVIAAVTDHLAEEARWGGYEAAERHAERIADIYPAAAAMLNCQSEEIAFVESATRGWDMAFYAIPLGPGDRVLTSVAEYASNYIAFLQVARRTGAKIEVVPNDEAGQLCVRAMANMIDDRVKLVAVTHVPTNGGLVNPAAEIGTVTRAAGVPFLLDACQSAGQLPLDVQKINCDLLSFTGRKYLRGPRGTGILYARREIAEQLEPPLLDLHAATWVSRDSYTLQPGARRFECWESNVPGKVGLACAIRCALDIGVERIERRVAALASHLRALLAELPGVSIRDEGSHPCGIVTFTAERRDPRELRDALLAEGVSVWYSETSSTRIDMEERDLTAVTRCSVHYYNTTDELDRFATKLRTLL